MHIYISFISSKKTFTSKINNATMHKRKQIKKGVQSTVKGAITRQHPI